MRFSRLIFFSIPIVILLLLNINKSVTRHHPDGILCAEEPKQDVLSGERPWKFDGYLVEPLAKFSIHARVLLTDNYYWSPNSDFSPLDLTLGWQEMSDSAVLKQITLSHGYRNYSWRAKVLPIPYERIVETSANMHMVPSTEHVARQLRELQVGDLVHIHGYLIEGRKADGWRWSSSLTRKDSGGGACELVWVERVSRN
jgi:hypothetical protein